jgi:hypothetical protein
MVMSGVVTIQAGCGSEKSLRCEVRHSFGPCFDLRERNGTAAPAIPMEYAEAGFGV